MKIFLPFQTKNIGGTATFVRKFKEGMERMGHSVFLEEPENYDVLFLVVQAPFKHLWRAKRQNKPIVQRLDGTYYWTVSGWRFPFYNFKAAVIRHFFTDFTVYQSEYSRFSVGRFLGQKIHERAALIYNGVDTALFTPEGEKKEGLRENDHQKIFFTASAFRRFDQILPLLDTLKAYSEKFDDNWRFCVAGSFQGKLRGFEKELKQYKNVTFLGKLDNAELPQYERSADVFLSSHLNPPCPNNIIEALACGLPVCGVADGGMSEIVTTGQEGYLLPAEGNAFWKTRLIDTEKFSMLLKKTTDEAPRLGMEARKRALSQFSLEIMLQQYLEIFRNLEIE